ncbi:MAG: hypothetical protein M0R06_20245 [Sphaerochaeta sp.]|jgi:hypothetical protein|nr:hypothetical protein [Sphaerochaeta sp.]
MTRLLVIMLLAGAPRLHAVPDVARPYVRLLRHEAVFVAWWIRTQGTLDAFIADNHEPTRDRQRAWQFRRKLL